MSLKVEIPDQFFVKSYSTGVGVFFGWNKFKVIKKSAIAYRVPQGKLYLFRRS